MLYEIIGKRLGRRFIRHLNPGATVPVSLPTPGINLDNSSCLKLLETPSADSLDTSQLRQSLDSVADAYREHGKQLLTTEQMALATVMLNTNTLADALRNDKKIDHSTVLRVNTHNSCLQVILLAEALGIRTIRLSRQHESYPATAKCLHTLHRPLSEVTIQGLEEEGRQLRERCEKHFTTPEQNDKQLESSWRLNLRYAGDDRVLQLKCMPLDMLLEQFEQAYRAEHGAPPDDNDVIVEALELSVSRRIRCSHGDSHPLVNSITSRWQQIGNDKEQGWDSNAKQPGLYALHPWLTDPQLNKILQSHAKPEAFTDPDDFFLEI